MISKGSKAQGGALIGVLALALAVNWGTGCAFLADLVGMGPIKPQVEVTDIALRGMSLTQIDLEVGLDVTNPNSFELSLSRINYQMDSLGLRIAHGEYRGTFTVPGKGKNQARVPVTIDTEAVKEFAKQLLRSKEKISAVFSGSTVFETPVGGIEMPFHQERTLLER